MWTDGWRGRFAAAADAGFDVLVIGGGITGAGVALEAAHAGLSVGLVEQHDFAAGASSGSSKLVHGGLRYLASDWRLTREAVHERERLMRAAPDLVSPLEFMLPVYRGQSPGRAMLRAGLTAYDFMAGRRDSHYLRREAFRWHMPYLTSEALRGGFVYRDALTDDARLVLRVLSAAVGHGAWIANYVGACELVHEAGRVAGATVADRITGDQFTIRARCVVNATGAWSDRLRAGVDGTPELRPLRGSHFVLPFHVLPVARAIAISHPDDRRPVFALPWHGATVFGTTDLDHDGALDAPRMSVAESDYLIAALRAYFPALGIRAEHALASYAGVRPVIASDAGRASDESRESAIQVERGLISVTGGKLTTFRLVARRVLERIERELGRVAGQATGQAADGRASLAPPAVDTPGPRTAVADARVGVTDYRYADLERALTVEAVEHLDDLMLRRTRLGLLLTDGGRAELDVIESLCRHRLGWDRARWQHERERYEAVWQTAHAPVRRP